MNITDSRVLQMLIGPVSKRRPPVSDLKILEALVGPKETNSSQKDQETLPSQEQNNSNYQQ